MVFSGKTPWVATTPNSRVNHGTMASTPANVTEETSPALKVDLPPEPVLPAPPAQEDGMKTLEHLRGLKQAMNGLPPELEQKLQDLEEKAQSQEIRLNHGHLNKMGKIQRQITALSDKVVKLDADWQTFVSQVEERFRKHKALFLETRNGLIKARKDKLMELELVKAEISRASQSLLNTEVATSNDVIDVDDAALMESLQQASAQLESLDEYPDPEDAEMETLELPDGTPAVRPFARRATAGSPSKVAKDHLKHKELAKARPDAKNS